MEELIFVEDMQPIVSEGMTTDAGNGDYYPEGGILRPGIRLLNDRRLDGDSVIVLPQISDRSPYGYTSDVFVVGEDARYDTYDDFSSKMISPGILNRSAVLLIQDDEATNSGRIERINLQSLGRNSWDSRNNSPDHTILGSNGNDIIYGGNGKDIIFGLKGNDQIFGEGGSNFLFGNQGNDSLYGGSGQDWLDGGEGADTLSGKDGNDTYVLDSLGDRIIDLPGTGTETVRSYLNQTTLQAGMDHLFLLGEAVEGRGNYLDNLIVGTVGSNVLFGEGGNDIIVGDPVRYLLRNYDPSLQERPNASKEFQKPAIINYQDYLSLAQNINLVDKRYEAITRESTVDSRTPTGADDILWGGAGNDTLFGQLGNDSLYGGEGDDRLDGGFGVDRLEGGGGNDIYVIDNINDLIIDAPQTGIETVESYITFDLRQYSMAPGSPIVGITGLDNLTLTRPRLSEFRNPSELIEYEINAFGNSLPNILIGNDQKNTIDGREGDDTIVVSNGDDTLIGGLGRDKFRFTAIPTAGKTTIQDFKPGEDVIEISKSAFSNPSLSQFSFNGSDLVFGGNSLATIQSSSPFSVNQNVRLI
jgi:Ca2+-binding RTX toxin-like protein